MVREMRGEEDRDVDAESYSSPPAIWSATMLGTPLLGVGNLSPGELAEEVGLGVGEAVLREDRRGVCDRAAMARKITDVLPGTEWLVEGE